MIMMIIITMDIEMCTGLQKRDSQCMTQLILITMATAIGVMMNGMDSDTGMNMAIMDITETIIFPILMKKMKNFTLSTVHMVNTMENILEQTQVNITDTIMMMNSVIMMIIMDITGNMTTMSTHMILFITVLFQNTLKGSTTHIISIIMDMDMGSVTTMIHGIMRDTCTKNMTGKVLTNGKESSIMNMLIIHTQMIHGSRKQSQALVNHVHKLIKPPPTRHHQRNLHKDQSQRKRESLLQLLLQRQLLNQLQSKLHQNPSQRQRLHLKNQHLQNNKKRKLKNRKRNQKWHRSLPRRRKL